jgi:hypothetical protein
MASAVTIRMQQNSFRRKFEDYIRPDPKNADRRRKGYTAVAVKMARVRRSHVRQRLSPLPGSDETRRGDPFASSRRGIGDLVDNARTFHLESQRSVEPGQGRLVLDPLSLWSACHSVKVEPLGRRMKFADWGRLREALSVDSLLTSEVARYRCAVPVAVHA